MKSLLCVSSLCLLAATSAVADESAEAMKRFRETLQQSSPGELYIVMGEELYNAPRGRRQATLEACDFGLGPGVLEGAYAQLPRYFADSDKVEDLESRLATCMSRLQGVSAELLPQRVFGDPRMADIQKLAAYVAAQSNGMPLAAPLRHPRELDAYRLGEALFYRRAGSHDFACASCHTLQDKRIRLQRLTNLVDPAEAKHGVTTWPAYRPTVGDVQPLELWISTCLYQARYPQIRFASEASIALQSYMAQRANGGVIAIPGVKR
jgi:sulfur-oxidizing protein SoxA